MNLRLDAVTDAALDDLAGLYERVFSAPPWNETWPSGAARTRLGEIHATPGFDGLLARDDAGRILAFAVGYAETYGAERHFFLKEMCVAPERQRAGVGSTLLAALEARVREAGCARLYLLTARGASAEAFYRACGFYANGRMIMMSHRLADAD